MNFDTLKVNMKKLEQQYGVRSTYEALLRSLENKQAYLSLKIEYMDNGTQTINIPVTCCEEVINSTKATVEQMLKRIESDIADIERICGITVK